MADSTLAMPPERIQPKPSGAVATRELVNRLDDLLKRYLELLDQYTQAREQLSKELSAGYIALAKANFNAPNRVRYGRDFYDERMQAQRTVTIEEKEDAKFHTSITLAAETEPNPRAEAEAKEKPASTPPAPSSSPTATEISKYPTPPPDSPQPSRDDDNASAAAPKREEHEKVKDEGEEDKRKQQQRQRDPIRWFGILVPQALRSAQGSFVGAVETAVPRTLNLAAEMRELEIEIGRVRKAIRKSGG